MIDDSLHTSQEEVCFQEHDQTRLWYLIDLLLLMTAWGHILRKIWLDELPMLYNWLRGDLGLIGVRPLSRHFQSLYPLHLQKLRQESKPGLLPPFYADMPETFEEICMSEERYLREYRRAPMRTQGKYFVLTVFNILIKGKRSG